MNQLSSLSSFRTRYSYWMVIAFLVLLSCSEDTEPAQVPPTISGYEPTSQFTGQSITISGENFGTNASNVVVTFYDEAVATVTEITNTSLVVTVPDNAYVGPVKVKVKNMEAEGGEFTVMTLCTIWVGEGPMPVPCPRRKLGDGPK
jgi:hypothetical protein